METWRQCEETGDALLEHEDVSGEVLTLRVPWEHRSSSVGWGRRPRARWKHPVTRQEMTGVVVAEGAHGVMARDEQGMVHPLPHGSFTLHSWPKVKKLEKASQGKVWVHAHQRDGHAVEGHWRELNTEAAYPMPEHLGGKVRVVEHDGTDAVVQHEKGPRVHMPLASVPHYVHDMNRQLPHPATSGDRAVDGVLEGRGQYIDKGNDGIVYRAPTGEAVKVSTTVPYQPHNRGHRTPEGAVAHLRHEQQAHEALSDLDLIPHVRGMEHDGRYFLVKPWAPPADKLTRAELDQAAKTLEEMHKRGWALNDTVQLGRDEDGHLWFQDLGQAREHAQPHEMRHDLERLDHLFRQHGQTRQLSGDELARHVGVLEFMLVTKTAEQMADPKIQARFAQWEDAHDRYMSELAHAQFEADEDPEEFERLDKLWTEANERGKAIRARLQPQTLAKGAHGEIPAGARWITVHPNGPDSKGQPILVVPAGDGTHRVIGGAGGSMNHLRLKGVASEEEMAARKKEHAKNKREAEKKRKAGLSREEREAEAAEADAQRARMEKAERQVIETVRAKRGGVDADLTEEDLAGLSDKAKERLKRQHHRKQLKQAMKARKDIAELLTSERMEQIEDEDAVEATLREHPDLWTEAHQMGERELALIAEEEESRKQNRRPIAHRADAEERAKAAAETAKSVLSTVDRAQAAKDLEDLGGRASPEGAMAPQVGETASEEQRRRSAEAIDNALILADAAQGREPAKDGARAALEFEVIRDAIEAAGIDPNASQEEIRAALANEAAIQLQRAQIAQFKADKFEAMEAAGKGAQAMKAQAHSDIIRGLTAEVRDATRKLGLREDAKTPIRQAEAAELMDVLRSFEALRDAKKGLDSCVREAEPPKYDASRRGFQLSLGDPPDHVVEGIEEQVMRELAVRILGMADEKSSAHVKAVTDGHYSKLADISLAVSHQNHLDRPVMDALGLKNSAILLRHALEQQGHDPDTLHNAVVGHHIREQKKLTAEALRTADAFVPHMEETIAETGDIEHAMKKLDAQEADIAEAQRAIGSALGQMESSATLAEAFRQKQPEHLTIELKDKGQGTVSSHLSWLASIGLGPADYDIDANAKQIRIHKDAWGKLIHTEPAEVVEQRKLAHAIKRGEKDEEGWLPQGVVSRNSTSFTDPPKSAPRYHTGLDLNADDMHTALGDHIGSRLADGERPSDIAIDLMSPQVAGKTANPEAFTDMVRHFFPITTEEDEKQRAENVRIRRERGDLVEQYNAAQASGDADKVTELAQKITALPKEQTVKVKRDVDFADHYEQLASDYLRRKHPGASAIHSQTLHQPGVEEHQVREAVFRALASNPEHAAAFTPLGELEPKHRQALQDYYYHRAGIAETRDWSAEFSSRIGEEIERLKGSKKADAASAPSLWGGPAPKAKELTPETFAELHPEEAKALAYEYPREGASLFKQAHGERPKEPTKPTRLKPEVQKAVEAIRENVPHMPAHELADKASKRLGRERAIKELGTTEEELASVDPVTGEPTSKVKQLRAKVDTRTLDLAERGVRPEHIAETYGHLIHDAERERFERYHARLGTPWSQFVDFHGGTANAYQALQAEMAGEFSKNLQTHYSKITGKTLQHGLGEVPNADLHQQALSTPKARKELADQKRKAMQERERASAGQLNEKGEKVGGTYQKGNDPFENFAASRDEKRSNEQRQSSMFGGGKPSPGKVILAEPGQKRDPKLGERVTLGSRVESEVQALLGGTMGKTLDPKKKVRLFAGANMDGRRVHQQRVIKMLRSNGGRLGAWLGVGSGKTPTSIGAFTDLHGTGDTTHGLFLVPSAVQSQFGEEMLSFTEPGKYHFETGDGKGHAERAAMLADKRVHMRVLTHESATKTFLKMTADHHGVAPEVMLERLRGMPDAERAKTVRQALEAHGVPRHYTYVDEAHKLTTRQGEQESDMSVMIGALSHPTNSTHALFGSATPHKNDTSEIHSMARLLDPERYSNGYRFMQKYGHGSVAAPDAIRRELDHRTYTASIPPDGVSRLDVPNPVVGPDGKKSPGGPIPLSPEHQKRVDGVTAAYQRAMAADKAGKVDVDAVKALSPDRFAEAPEAEHEKIAKELAPSLGIVKETAIRKALQLEPEEHNEKLRRMLETIDHDVKGGKPSIVFTDSLQEAQHVHQHLVKRGLAAGVYHGGLTGDARDKFRQEFKQGGIKVGVMTSAGEAGINMQEGKVVHHYDVPKTAKSWSQRNGRAFRQGQKDDVDVHDWQHAHDFDTDGARRLQDKAKLGDVFQTPLGPLDEHGFAHDYHQALVAKHNTFDPEGLAPPKRAEAAPTATTQPAAPAPSPAKAPAPTPSSSGGTTSLANVFSGGSGSMGTDRFIDSMWQRHQDGKPIQRMGQPGSIEHKLRDAQKAGKLTSRDVVEKMVKQHYKQGSMGTEDPNA